MHCRHSNLRLANLAFATIGVDSVNSDFDRPALAVDGCGVADVTLAGRPFVGAGVAAGAVAVVVIDTEHC